MKTKKTFSIILLFINVIFFAQKSITIIGQNKKPLKNVALYTSTQKIANSDELGNVIIDSRYSNDTIHFIKNEFINRSFYYKNIPTQIFLDSLKTIDIDGVVIKKYDGAKIIKKIIQIGRTGNIYSKIGNVSIFNTLKSNEKLFYSVDNNFFWKSKQGRFIENRDNIEKNFTSKTYQDGNKKYIEKVIELNGEKIALYPFRISNYGYVTGKAIPQLFEIENDIDDYIFETKTSEEKIIITFKPKKNSSNLFIGRVILDSEDFGIYEAIFNLVKNSNNIANNKIASKDLRENFLIEKEQFILRNKKENGVYKFDFSNYDLEFKILTGTNKGELLRNKMTIKAIDFLNINTSEKFDLQTFEFE